MADLSLHHRIERAHGIFMPQARGVGVGGGRPETYMVSFPRVLKSVACLVGRCPVRAHKPGRIRENFIYLHLKAQIAILQEGPAPLPPCNHCGIHTPEMRL